MHNSPATALHSPLSSELTELADFQDAARRYLEAAKAPSTRHAYRRDWDAFASWCQTHGLQPLPADPSAVALYLAALADSGLSPSTIGRRSAAIAAAHRGAGLESPTTHPGVREVTRGIRRTHGTHRREVEPVTTAILRRMLTAIDSESAKGLRDRAVLLVGYAGALRRSELVALNVHDARSQEDGVTLRIRQSKTDQEGRGRTIALPYGSHLDTCPVQALSTWLDVVGAEHGPIFRRVRRGDHVTDARLRDQSVALIVKRTARAAGLNPAVFSGHSLRAGFATQAAANGAPERTIAAQTGHRSVPTLRRYIRIGGAFRGNAATSLGL